MTAQKRRLWSNSSPYMHLPSPGKAFCARGSPQPACGSAGVLQACVTAQVVFKNILYYYTRVLRLIVTRCESEGLGVIGLVRSRVFLETYLCLISPPQVGAAGV